MPGLNRMGPTGEGSMTGRCMGFCTETNSSENIQRGRQRRNANFGAGFGRGLRQNQNLNYDMRAISPEEVKEVLAKQKDFLEKELSDIELQLKNYKT